MFIQNGAAGLARRRRRYSKKGNPLPVYKNRAGLSVFLVTEPAPKRASDDRPRSSLKHTRPANLKFKSKHAFPFGKWGISGILRALCTTECTIYTLRKAKRVTRTRTSRGQLLSCSGASARLHGRCLGMTFHSNPNLSPLLHHHWAMRSLGVAVVCIERHGLYCKGALFRSGATDVPAHQPRRHVWAHLSADSFFIGPRGVGLQNVEDV